MLPLLWNSLYQLKERSSMRLSRIKALKIGQLLRRATRFQNADWTTSVPSGISSLNEAGSIFSRTMFSNVRDVR